MPDPCNICGGSLHSGKWKDEAKTTLKTRDCIRCCARIQRFCSCGMPEDLHGPSEHPFDFVDLSRQNDSLVDIVGLAMTLHGSTTGAADPLPVDEEGRIIGLLSSRLHHWRSPHPRSVVFDSAVRDIIIAALTDVRLSK